MARRITATDDSLPDLPRCVRHLERRAVPQRRTETQGLGVGGSRPRPGRSMPTREGRASTISSPITVRRLARRRTPAVSRLSADVDETRERTISRRRGGLPARWTQLMCVGDHARPPPRKLDDDRGPFDHRLEAVALRRSRRRGCPTNHRKKSRRGRHDLGRGLDDVRGLYGWRGRHDEEQVLRQQHRDAAR